MNGWIIYNGSLRTPKFKELVQKLVLEAEKMGVKLEAITNRELFPIINSRGKVDLKSLKNISNPDFIVFWDKDIKLAKHLELMGYRLFNSSEAIMNCDHKALMHLKMANKHIRVPKTIIGPYTFYDHELPDQYIDYIIDELGPEVIIKEAYGSFGMQVYKVNEKEELTHQLKEIEGRDFIFQEPIRSSFGKDIRVNIVGNQIVGGMKREFASDFRANITLGGKGEVVALTKEQKDLALRAHQALNLDFSGVDLLFGADGESIVCEVNSNVNFLSYEKISGINVGGIILDYIIGELS
ncbi:RimK family alpha-L-glutamate ligase [Alkalibacillus silvisoli]|uniref:RimK family alpha-L-glutamate ligase n=1 Tax=Alkalibacillus silvisoli TaxID=392823 RepID=A0ABN0ZZT1_9BACI